MGRTMPRYFFHICSNRHGRSDDELGLDFASVETACSEALRAAQDLEGVFVARSQDPRDHAIEVTDEAGRVVLHLSFSEIFDRRCYIQGSEGAFVATDFRRSDRARINS
jgi:hypothetical protein